METHFKSRVVSALILMAVGIVAGGCSKAPPDPDASNVPVSLQIDSIQKDPTLTTQQKQQKIQELQNKR